MYVDDATMRHVRDSLVGWSFRGINDVSYTLEERIGEGGQGWVFRATSGDQTPHRVVAKILRPDSVRQVTLARFRREAQVLQMLSTGPSAEPHIVRFHDHGLARRGLTIAGHDHTFELPYTVLEYVEGCTLDDVLQLQAGRGMPVARALSILQQVVSALEAVHRHRIVHRDLKPSNILISTERGQELVKVTDFGLAKVEDLKLTQTSTIAGASLGYAPPEQYEEGNERVTPATDVFSFAAVAFELLSGLNAFPASESQNPYRVISRMLRGPRPTLGADPQRLAVELRCASDLVQRVDTALGRALQAEPTARQQSIAELWRELSSVLQEAESRTLPVAAAFPPGAGARAGSKQARSVLPPTLPDDGAHAMMWAPTESGGSFGGFELCAPVAERRFRCASCRSDGSIFALGGDGLARWDGAGWVAVPAVGCDPARVRAMCCVSDGRVLLVGDAGLVWFVDPDGQRSPMCWGWDDPSVTFVGAHLESTGELLLVGQRRAGASGVLARLGPAAGSARVMLEWEVGLRGVVRLAGGQLLACGDAGTLLWSTGSDIRPLRWNGGGHLHAIARAPGGGACVVGSGGHALSISPAGDVVLESVQTTRSLWAVTSDSAGAMWAAGAAGRILRRRGVIWERISTDRAWGSRLICLAATARGLFAVGDDGLVAAIRRLSLER